MFIILFLAYGIEPALWLVILSSIFQKKDNVQKLDLVLSWMGAFAIICVKQIVSISNILPIADILMVILLMVYYIWQYFRIYKCNKFKMLVWIAVMSILALFSECITAIVVPYITGWSIEEMSYVGFKGIISTYISKGILIILSFTIFKTRIRKFISRQIVAPEIILILAGFIGFEIPTIIIYNNIKLINYQQDILIYYVISQVFVLLLVVGTIIIIEKHKKKDKEFNDRMVQSYVKLKAYEEANELEIKRYKHDLKNHIKVLQELHRKGRYEDADQYLNALQENLESSTKFFSLSNKIVEALLNQKREEILEKKIFFIPQIGVESYVMSDVEICSVLSNLLDNAIEATMQLPEKQREIELTIMGTKERNGYLVDVINTSKEPVCIRNEFISSKGKKGHGIGMKIIKRTIEQYNGRTRFEYTNGKFHVKIFVPYNKE